MPECHEENRGEITRQSALERSGSLANKYPELVKQWHLTKNENLTRARAG